MIYLLLILVFLSFVFLYYANSRFEAYVEDRFVIIRLVHRVVKIPIDEISEMKYLTGTDFRIPFVHYDNGVVIGWNNKIYPVVLGRMTNFREKDIALMKTVITKNNKILVSKNLLELVGQDVRVVR